MVRPAAVPLRPCAIEPAIAADDVGEVHKARATCLDRTVAVTARDEARPEWSIARKVEALEAFVARKEDLKRTAPLRYLFWESTLRCNLTCLHCGSDCVRDDASRERELDADTVKRELCSIAKAYPADQMTFAMIGGEPLLRQDVPEVGAYAAGLGYGWGITTNAMLLDRSMVRRLRDARLRTISVSLDGVEADHDRLRNHPGCYRTVTRHLRSLLEDRFFDRFDVICCVSRINVDHLEEFMEELLRLEVPAVRFTPVFSRGRAGRNANLMLGNADITKMLDFVARQRASQSRINVCLSEEGYYGPRWECVVRDELHYCASGIQIGTILHDGAVTGCPSVSRRFLEGSVRDAPFVEIWKTGFSRYRQDRKRSFSRLCGDCDHWVLCEGGGFHLLDQDDVSRGFCCLEKTGQNRRT